MTRARRCARLAALVAVPLLPMAALLAPLLARPLVVEELPPGSADAIVVLAGASTYLERTAHAARLLHEGRAPRVLLTHDGGRTSWLPEEERNPFFVEHAFRALRWEGATHAQIEILPQPVRSTHDEALLLREVTRERGLRSILLVTSAYHSRRALDTFRRALTGTGTSVYVSPAATGEQTPSPALWWTRWLGWKLVPGEYLKLAYYRVRDRV